MTTPVANPNYQQNIGQYGPQATTQPINYLTGQPYNGQSTTQPTTPPTTKPTTQPTTPTQSQSVGLTHDQIIAAGLDENNLPAGVYRSDVAGAAGGLGLPTQPKIDLPGLYTNLTNQAGIPALQQKLTDAETAYNENKGKINDNPFLSEGDRTGRIAKLTSDYNDSIKPIQDEMSMKQADIKMQLDLQTQQFNINSQEAKTAFDQFNSLLSSGALDNASGTDIASITRATGISSSMIQSAITAAKTKNAKMIQYDDGTKQGVAIIDDQGNLIKKTDISASTKNNLIDTQQRQITASATKQLIEVDTNGDKLISLDEYKQAVELIIAETGVSSSEADNYLTQQMQMLGYGKWRW